MLKPKRVWEDLKLSTLFFNRNKWENKTKKPQPNKNKAKVGRSTVVPGGSLAVEIIAFVLLTSAN